MENTNLKIKDLGNPLFVGRSADVFRWEDGKLLKLFLPHVDPKFCQSEIQNLKETFEKKVSDVQPFEVVKIEGRDGIIIKELTGRTLLSLVNDDENKIPKVCELMAQLHLDIHNKKTQKMRSYKDVVCMTLSSETLNFLTDEQKYNIIQYIESLPDGDSVLHLDFHPDNIIFNGDNHTSAIDWATAAKGNRTADVATTVFLLAEGGMVRGLTKEQEAHVEKFRKTMLHNYLQKYKEKYFISDQDIQKWRLAALIVRLGLWRFEEDLVPIKKSILEELRFLKKY